jgi:hypothetical protein
LGLCQRGYPGSREYCFHSVVANRGRKEGRQLLRCDIFTDTDNVDIQALLQSTIRRILIAVEFQLIDSRLNDAGQMKAMDS